MKESSPPPLTYAPCVRRSCRCARFWSSTRSPRHGLGSWRWSQALTGTSWIRHARVENWCVLFGSLVLWFCIGVLLCFFAYLLLSLFVCLFACLLACLLACSFVCVRLLFKSLVVCGGYRFQDGAKGNKWNPPQKCILH